MLSSISVSSMESLGGRAREAVGPILSTLVLEKTFTFDLSAAGALEGRGGLSR